MNTFTHPFTKRTYSRTHSLTPPLAHSLTLSLAHSLIHDSIHTRTQTELTHQQRQLTHSFTLIIQTTNQLITMTFTQSTTGQLTHYIINCLLSQRNPRNGIVTGGR